MASARYGVPILLSDAFVDALLLEEHVSCVRRIDCVRLKGSALRMSLYTYDCGEAAGYVDGIPGVPGTATSAAPGGTPGQGPDGGGCTGCAFPEYRELFRTGVDAYVAGDWAAAADTLRKCVAAWPADAPPRVLLAYMDGLGGKAPDDWDGVRELMEK